MNCRRIFIRALFAAVICCASARATPALPPLERSVSASRQFIVYASDAQLRGALCEVADRIKSQLLALLQESDNWKTPIVINARLPEANVPEIPPASLRISQTGFGLKLQLDLQVKNDLDVTAIEREILRVVLIETMYRTRLNLPAGTYYAEPPPWLVEGLLAQSRDLQRSRTPLQLLVTAHKTVPLENFLRERPELLDAPSHEIYSAYSAALLALLIDSPNGKNLLAKFIFDLPDAPGDALENLPAHFPVLGESAAAVEDNWQAGVARFASVQSPRSLGVAASEHELDELLQRPIDGQPSPLENFAALRRSPKRAVIFNALSDELMRLGSRAHPLCRPMIFEYQKIAFGLAHGKTFHVARRLAQLKESRTVLVARMRAIDDYMNWFEATQARTRSGNFTDYLKDAAQSPAEPRRHDPISVYLDALETNFQN